MVKSFGIFTWLVSNLFSVVVSPFFPFHLKVDADPAPEM
jgi:hypothetical protein